MPAGKGDTRRRFAYDGKQGERGKGGSVTISANGKKVAEGMDIGQDVGSPVDFSYKLPFTFTGKIEKVTFEVNESCCP